MNIDTNQNKSESEFVTKVFSHIDRLFHFSLLMTGDERQAEKYLVLTYKKAFWFHKHLSGKTDIELWLFRIMMNINRNCISTFDDDNQNYTSNHKIDLSKINTEEFQKKQSFKTTKELIIQISSLPYKLKEAFILIDALKFNHEQAADLIDVPAGVVRSRLFDARKFLLTKLLSDTTGYSINEEIEITQKDKKDIVTFIDEHGLEESTTQSHKNINGEIDAQRFVKNIIDEHLVPQPVRPAIKLKIVKKSAPNLKNKIKNETRTERRGLVVGATIAMIILLTVLIIINRPEIINPGDFGEEQTGNDNILVQLRNNYSSVVEGKFNAVTTRGNEKTLKNFLAGSGIEYAIEFFNLKHWNIDGCFVTEFNEKKLANFIYKDRDDKLLYVYQVPLSFVEEDRLLRLTDNLLDYLKTENCYLAREENITYLLKRNDNNIFSFASEILNKNLIVEICKYKL